MPLRAHICDRGRKRCWRKECTPTRWGKQLAGRSGRKPDFFCLAPIALQSRAARATASGCPAGSVSLSLGPKIRPVPYRPPSQTQVLLHSPHPDSSEQASKHLPLFVGLPQDCHKPPVAEQHSSDRSPRSLCCQLVMRNPQPAWSVPAPCQDDQQTPQYQTRSPIQSSLRACPYTTVAVRPSRRNPP